MGVLNEKRCKKNIALFMYGQFRSYKNNLRKNIQMLEPILKNHNIHLFILSDKLESGNYSKDNEKDIKNIFEEFNFNIHIFDYIENYSRSEENETVLGYYNNIKNMKGINPFVPNLMYRKYLINKLKNEYITKNNLHIDLMVYCRLFDMILLNNIDFDLIEKEINIIYDDPSIIYGSSDNFFISSSIIMDYLFNIVFLYKEGKLYHDNIWEQCDPFISTMDYCLCQLKHIYSPEIQYIAHMFYSGYTYKNMRFDYNNPNLELNISTFYHVYLDPNRKTIDKLSNI